MALKFNEIKLSSLARFIDNSIRLTYWTTLYNPYHYCYKYDDISLTFFFTIVTFDGSVEGLCFWWIVSVWQKTWTELRIWRYSTVFLAPSLIWETDRQADEQLHSAVLWSIGVPGDTLTIHILPRFPAQSMQMQYISAAARRDLI